VPNDPAPTCSTSPPTRHHLLDRPLFLRAVGVLGPVEAFVGLAAFLVVFVAAGWPREMSHAK